MSYMRQRGLGEYEHTGDWGWEYYPPPYDFLAPSDSVPMPAPILGRRRGPVVAFSSANRGGFPARRPIVAPGVGGCHCGGTCGHCKAGLGLFDSMDFTTWGVGEWATVALGVYLLSSMFGDTRRVARSVSKGRARRKRERSRRAAERVRSASGWSGG